MRFTIFTIFLCFCSSSVAKEQATLLLISIDGFSHQYLADYKPKNLLSLANNGVSAQGLVPVFPTKTFPNHLSIVTGVYPSKHGIVHNYFYHKTLKKHYRVGAGKNDPAWLRQAPIWVKAQQQGKKSAIYFWPESEASFQGLKPSRFLPYKHNTKNETRINQVIKWLKEPEDTRPQFIATYFSTVDSAGHDFGPKSKEVRAAIEDVDLLIGKLVAAINNEVEQPVNLVIVSDHGMTETNEDSSLKIDELIESDDSITIVNGQSQIYIYSERDAALDDVYKQVIKKIRTEGTDRYKIYRRGEYPEHWRFNIQSPVVPDLIVDAIPPFKFAVKSGVEAAAIHGYDPKYTNDLNGIFIAHGPDIVQGKLVPSFENIHVYPLLESLLALTPSADIDASHYMVERILIK